METRETLLKRAHAMLSIGSHDGLNMALSSLTRAERRPPLLERLELDFQACLADKSDIPLAYRAEALRLGTVAALDSALNAESATDPWTRTGAIEAADRLWLAIGSAEGLLAYAHSDALTLSLASAGMRELIEGTCPLPPCEGWIELAEAIGAVSSELEDNDRSQALATLSVLRKCLVG
jgi:hypothetical protein